jgi:hypothetical protein
VGVKTDHRRAPARRRLHYLLDVRDGVPELRLRPGGADLLVVPQAAPRIYPQSDLAAAKQIGRLVEQMRPVNGHLGAMFESDRVLVNRAEVGSEQHERGRAGELAYPNDLRSGDTLDPESLPNDGLEHAWVRIGLHRVVEATDGMQMGAQRFRARLDGGKVIDVERPCVREQLEQGLALVPPPVGRARVRGP